MDVGDGILYLVKIIYRVGNKFAKNVCGKYLKGIK